MWLPEPKMRPRAWISNFAEEDQFIAARLLERFVFYSQRLTDSLLLASFNSIADGLKKGARAPDSDRLLQALSNAVFTPVCGEKPNPTDSGNYLCRLTRQVIGVPEARIVQTQDALGAARTGRPIVFVDDFIGSGDQFITTWQDDSNGHSFESIHNVNRFAAIYLTLVATDSGIATITQEAPSVAICATHKLDAKCTLWGLRDSDNALFSQSDALLKKYAPRLTPQEPYMQSAEYLLYGYKKRALFFGFEHSIPDATLPIFWCRGTNNWEPLVERT